MAQLETNGVDGRAFFSLDGLDRVIIGRHAECELVLADDPAISRAHARLERTGPTWTISDLDSANGTLVQGERIVGPRRLHHADEFTVGRTVLRFVDGDELQNRTKRTQPAAPELTKTELAVLVELCRPLFTPGRAFRVPATTHDIAKARVTGDAAVRMVMTSLFEKFGIVEGENRRIELAEAAVQRGVISRRHYPPDDSTLG